MYLSRKQTIRAHGQRIIIAHKGSDRAEHTAMKALIWALYLPQYPEAQIERRIGDRYKPDVVQLDDYGDPIFWGEAGKVSPKKIASLVRRFPEAHFVIAKWGTSLDPYIAIVEDALEGRRRAAPFDLINFAPDAWDRFVAEDGTITLTHDDLRDWVRLGAGDND